MPNPPKPTALKLLQGNPGKHALPANEPQLPIVTDLTSPQELDAYGRRCWQRNASVLAKSGLLTDGDRDALMLYCDAYSQWRRGSLAQRRLKPGDPIYRQVAITVEKARDQMRLIGHELGLSPSARVRLSVGKPAESRDDMEDILSGRRSTA